MCLACTQPGNPVGPGSNRAPFIRGVALAPSLISLGGQAAVSVDAVDPDGDALFYGYAAAAGTVTADKDRPWTAVYVNGGSAGESDRIAVTVTDAHNTATVFSATVALQGNRVPEVLLPAAEACHPSCRNNSTVDTCNGSCALNFLVRASDPDGDPLTYTWGGCVTDSNGPRGTCQITAPGSYTATVVVRDTRGGVVVVSARGEGTNRAPSVGGGGTVHANTLRLVIVEHDPDGDPVKCAWAGTCQCIGDTQSFNQTCSIPGGVETCFEVATCFDPYGARGDARFDMFRP